MFPRYFVLNRLTVFFQVMMNQVFTANMLLTCRKSRGRICRETKRTQYLAQILFYAATLAFSLMTGKYSLAQVPQPAPAVTVLTVSPQIVTAPPASVLTIDKEILAARDAYDRRDSKTLDVIRQRIANSGHPLVPYVTYWWLSVNMWQSGASALTQAGEIAAFLDAQGTSPLTDGLRRDWLRLLGNADAWHLFGPAAAKFSGDDAEVTCHQWRYRLSRDDRDALSEIKAAFVSGKNTADSCYDAYESAQTLGAFSADDIWTRIRRTLENNQPADARKTAALLSTPSSRFESGLSTVAADPAKFLSSQKADLRAKSSVELFLFAVARLARNDAARAANLVEKYGARLAKDQLAYAWAQIGLYGGMQHDPIALTWFRKAGEIKLNDLQASWKARAALRARDWPAVREAIDAMSATEKRESSWRYWRARALAETGQADAARAILEALARELGFYPLLAAEEIGIATPPTWNGYKPNKLELEAALARPAVQRGLALYRIDLKTEGFREWQYAARGLNDQELLAAAEIARQSGIPDRAIGAAVRTIAVHDFSQRFPTPHRTDLQTSARSYGLDAAWVYGLIRQESRFMTDARSRAGAMGLMQLMPATAKWAAGRVGVKNLDVNRVVDVPLNLNLGSYYLRHVLDDLGHPVLATAAYNAGPGRAKRWRAEGPLEGAIYAESIPFSETRDYVKQVMTNAWYYGHQLGTSKVSLKEIMGKVPGRAGGGQSTAFGTLPGTASVDAASDIVTTPAATSSGDSVRAPESSAPTPETVTATPNPNANALSARR
jgi:soluble lytic murein transglycosylase